MDSWSARRAFFTILLVLLALYLPSATYDYRINVDAAMAAMPAWNWVENGTLDLAEHEEVLEQRAGRTIHTVETDEGRIYSNRSIGVVLWGVPFYALATPVVESVQPFPMWPAAVAGAVATALAMAVLHLVLRRVATPSEATVGALVFGLGTGAWSVAADGLWPHGPAMLWLAGALLALAGGRHGRAGLAFALALLMRPYNALAAAVCGLGASLRRRSAWPAILLGVLTLLGGVVLIVVNDALFGQPNLAGGYSEIESHATVTDLGQRDYPRIAWNLGGAFFDPQRGMVWYSPFVVMLVPGLRDAWRTSPGWARDGAVSAVAVFLAQYWVQVTQGGAFFFSYRYPLEALLFASPLLLASWRSWVAPSAARRRVFRLLVVLAVALQVLGAVFEPYTWG